MSTAHFIVFVADQEVSARFYEAVLGRAPRLHVLGMTEFVLSDGAVLGLMPRRGAQRLLGDALDTVKGEHLADARSVRCELYLLVDDPRASHQRAITAGARELSPVSRRDWGHDAGYTLDPDGHVLAFAFDPVARQRPSNDGGSNRHAL